MILASHQPNFFPYMGYFYKIARCDLFLFSNDVQFSNTKTGDMHNYNYIKGPQGKQKITLPVTYLPGALVKDVMIFDDKKQVNGILKAINQYYGKTPFFDEVYPHILSMFNIGFNFLSDFNINAIKWFCLKFGIKTRIELSPELTARKDDRIIELCKFTGADTYLSGSGAAAYHVKEKYDSNCITLEYSDYVPPEYPQRYGEFIPNLSVIDWVFNMGYSLPEGWLSWKR